MVEDSQRKEEESEQSTDSSSKEIDGYDMESEVPSSDDSDSEPNNEINGSIIETKESQIEKLDEVKFDHGKTTNPDKGEEEDDHSIKFHEVLDNDLFNSIRSRKDQLLRYTAAAVGVILIIYGIVLISASVTKVADNVIFGDGASFAAFSMLLGFLIIVGAFSQKILNRTFLKKISSELEIAEGKTVVDDEKTEDLDGKKDPKNVKDDKDNIVGEDKK